MRKIKSWLGLCLQESARSPHVCVCFPRVLRFPPMSQSYAREVNWRVYIAPVRGSAGVGMSVPCRARTPWRELLSARSPELWEMLQAPKTLDWNRWVRKESYCLLYSSFLFPQLTFYFLNFIFQLQLIFNIILLFIFLKCIYSSYLFQCLILEGFWVFILKFGDVFVTRNIPLGT